MSLYAEWRKNRTQFEKNTYLQRVRKIPLNPRAE